MFNTNPITKDIILTNIKQERIFERYLNITPKFGTAFKNPLRADEHGDCYFYIGSNNMLKFHDIPMGWNWDCFNLVQKINNCGFYQALDIIAIDFNLKESDKVVKDVDSQYILFVNDYVPKELKVILREWSHLDTEYWNQFGIDINTLNYYNVKPLRKAFSNDRSIYRHRGTDLGYMYYFGDGKMKLYFPSRRKNDDYVKFIQNCPFVLQGGRQLQPNGDFIVITKSMKDVMSMSMYDIPAIAPTSESVLIRDYQMDILRKRFKKIFILYDRDRTGMKFTIRMRDTYNVIPLFFDKGEPKDFADNVQKYGNNYMVDLIEHYKDLLL